MLATSFNNFITLFPQLPRQYVEKLYMQPFSIESLLEYFEGWEYLTTYDCYIDQSEDRNLLRFAESGYSINSKIIHRPVTLNDFIEGCLLENITLLWSEAMADRLWLTEVSLSSVG
jgi:hypothetical protein